MRRLRLARICVFCGWPQPKGKRHYKVKGLRTGSLWGIRRNDELNWNCMSIQTAALRLRTNPAYVEPRRSQHCFDCDGQGYLYCRPDGGYGDIEIQRCDTCRIFESDDEADQHHKSSCDKGKKCLLWKGERPS